MLDFVTVDNYELQSRVNSFNAWRHVTSGTLGGCRKVAKLIRGPIPPDEERGFARYPHGVECRIVRDGRIVDSNWELNASRSRKLCRLGRGF